MPDLATIETTAVPVEITVKRYVCPFCSRGHSKRAAAAGHISKCFRNPATRSCRTCVHLLPDESEWEVGYEQREACDAGIDLDVPGPYGLHAQRRSNCEKWMVAE